MAFKVGGTTAIQDDATIASGNPGLKSAIINLSRPSNQGSGFSDAITDNWETISLATGSSETKRIGRGMDFYNRSNSGNNSTVHVIDLNVDGLYNSPAPPQKYYDVIKIDLSWRINDQGDNYSTFYPNFYLNGTGGNRNSANDYHYVMYSGKSTSSSANSRTSVASTTDTVVYLTPATLDFETYDNVGFHTEMYLYKANDSNYQTVIQWSSTIAGITADNNYVYLVRGWARCRHVEKHNYIRLGNLGGDQILDYHIAGIGDGVNY